MTNLRAIQATAVAAFTDEFRQSLPTILAALDAVDRDRSDRAAVKEAHRLIHALKGGASMVGLAAFGYLLNVAEELIETSATRSAPVTEEVVEGLRASMPRFASYMDAALAGQPVEPIAVGLARTLRVARRRGGRRRAEKPDRDRSAGGGAASLGLRRGPGAGRRRDDVGASPGASGDGSRRARVRRRHDRRGPARARGSVRRGSQGASRDHRTSDVEAVVRTGRPRVGPGAAPRGPHAEGRRRRRRLQGRVETGAPHGRSTRSPVRRRRRR